MKKEYDFSKAKKNKGPVTQKKGNKIQKTFRLDEDVFEWLINEGEKRGLPYQTLMNSLLKQMMNQEKTLIKRIERIEDKLKIKKTS